MSWVLPLLLASGDVWTDVQREFCTTDKQRVLRCQTDGSTCIQVGMVQSSVEGELFSGLCISHRPGNTGFSIGIVEHTHVPGDPQRLLEPRDLDWLEGSTSKCYFCAVY